MVRYAIESRRNADYWLSVTDPHLITRIHQLLKLLSLSKRLDNFDGERIHDLFQLSIEKNNELVTTAFMELSDVRYPLTLKEYYSRVNKPVLGLQEASSNKESSMRKFEPGEQRIVDLVKGNYRKLMVEMGGCNAVCGKLMSFLKEQYIAMPATVVVNSRTLTLPFDWSDFTRMSLSVAQRDSGYKAYYQHITHTAHRFLVKVNPMRIFPIGSPDRGAHWS